MSPTARLFFIPIFLLLVFSADAAGLDASWVFLDLPVDQELSTVGLLESKGIPVLAWSNSIVEVSGFQGVETVPLAELDRRLTAQDPRWDPWLTGLKPSFRPREGISRIWVETTRRQDAQRLVGQEVGSVLPAPRPRQITGWILVGFSLLYGIFRFWADRREGRIRARRYPTRWLWLPLALVVFGGGVVLVTSGAGVRTAPSATLSASWLQHLWFQESWPYGATWNDWSPRKAWSYRSYERRDGRLFEVMTALPVPDKAWAAAALAGLDSHHAARIFGLENP